ncbi:uncharacterized protein J8A68_003318 [[Candida] subhashii]|uniref:Uncharacterized protein n=1 Tax=[Candida] subhashii TaxID=561895 RepID=A0A8J5UWQ2_9ASCO|nr:uncharacterized protein J8A68_003318 [[Candida] subhashii]KAG7663140.1 hypothetical protein J8A68_003318 [[Candida] subhashii]
MTPPKLQYSAAKTSSISKRSSPSSSPIKKFQRSIKKILPSQKLYSQALATKTSKPSSSSSSSSPDKLEIVDYNVELDYQLCRNEDIMVAIDTILNNRWSESTSLHNHYHTRDEIIAAQGNMEELIMNLKGLGMGPKVDILKYRTHQLPKGLITTSLLYSIYENRGNTFVDRILETKIRQGEIRKFVITNASPVISRSNTSGQRNNRVTYGFENVEVVVKAEMYLNQIRNSQLELAPELAASNDIVDPKRGGNRGSSLKKFEEYVIKNPTALFINIGDEGDGGFNNEELSHLVSLGFVTLTSNHLNEIESHQYSISYPNCGTYLKLVNAGRVWLVKLLSKPKYKEMLEEQIVKKWEGTTLQGDSKMNNFRKPFYGYDLNWVLADSHGSGIVEVFNTPVGRGWRLTGKV